MFKPLSILIAISVILTGCMLSDDEKRDQRIAETHKNDKPVATPVASTAPIQAVESKEVSYATIDGKEYKGYLAMPKGANPKNLPALLVLHEWWGLNDNIRKTTDRLAAQGYVALALDFYGGVSAEKPVEAMKMMAQLRKKTTQVESNIQQGHAFLQSKVGNQKTGVIGWCMGGRWSLRTAILLPDDIDAAVMYYGSVSDDEEKLKTLDMPIIGFFAGKDRIVPMKKVLAFDETMQRLNKSFELHTYPDSDHGFSNPNGTVYDEAAANDAWGKATRFLEANLK